MAKEEVLEEYCLQLKKQGSPIYISQLKHIAEELLRVKRDTELIKKNWLVQFIKRYLILKSVFISLQDRNRQLSEDLDIITHWFKLYKDTIDEYNIEPEDIYNMDKKSIVIGVIGKERYIVSKSKKRPKTI